MTNRRKHKHSANLHTKNPTQVFFWSPSACVSPVQLQQSFFIIHCLCWTCHFPTTSVSQEIAVTVENLLHGFQSSWQCVCLSEIHHFHKTKAVISGVLLQMDWTLRTLGAFHKAKPIYPLVKLMTFFKFLHFWFPHPIQKSVLILRSQYTVHDVNSGGWEANQTKWKRSFM